MGHMDVRRLIKKVLIESSMYNGARDIVRLFMGLKELKMLETSSGPNGETVTWFRSSADGHLYEVIVNSVKNARYPLPDKLKPKENLDEPLSPNDVMDHIKEKLGNNIEGIRLVRDNSKYFDYELFFDRKNTTRDGLTSIIQANVMVPPFHFTILPRDVAGKLILRYHKG